MSADHGTPPAPLLPTPDRDSAPWWDALAAKQLLVQVCESCAARRWPARAMCGRCGSFEVRWEATAGTGTVAARTTTHHAFLPGFTPPYHTVLVRLDVEGGQDDIVVPGGWSGDAEPVVGQKVQADYRVVEANGESATLLQWRSYEVGA